MMQEEQLSLLMDGEEFNAKIVTQLAKDKISVQRWHQYHLIRETMRGSLHPVTVNLDLAQQIEKEIQGIKLETSGESLLSKAKRLWKNISLKETQASGWWMPVGQMSVAACVALVVIVGVQNYNTEEFQDIKPALSTIPVGVNVQPVGYDSFNQANETKQKENDRLHILLQDYERQRRMYLQ